MRKQNTVTRTGGMPATRMLAALGSECRLRVFKLLVKEGEQGIMIGDLQSELRIAPSTLAHHLSVLLNAGLIWQYRKGTSIYNVASYGVVDELINYLTEECCANNK